MKPLKQLTALLFLFFVATIHAEAQFSKWEKLENQGDRKWKNGDLVEAEKLIREAYKENPTPNILWRLALKKLDLGDIKGYNSVWNEIVEPIRIPPTNSGPNMKPAITGTRIARRAGIFISAIAP